MCQVFYHKEETNHWTVTVAFLSIEQAHKHSLVSSMPCFMSAIDNYYWEQSIASFYQDAITGPVSVFQFKKGSNASVEVGVVKKTTAELGWDVAIDSQHNMVNNNTYNRKKERERERERVEWRMWSKLNADVGNVWLVMYVMYYYRAKSPLGSFREVELLAWQLHSFYTAVIQFLLLPYWCTL